MLISHDTNFSWNFSRDNSICYTTWVIDHVIQAFISRDIEPDVCIRGFSFILKMDAEDMVVFANILRTNLISLMPAKKVRAELSVRVPYNIHLVVIAEPRAINSQIYGHLL